MRKKFVYSLIGSRGILSLYYFPLTILLPQCLFALLWLFLAHYDCSIVHSFRFKPYYLFTGESIFFTIERRSTIYPKVQFFHMATEGKNERTNEEVEEACTILQKSRYYCKVMESPYTILNKVKGKETFEGC